MKKNILIVDDDQRLRELLKDYLSEKKLDVFVCDDFKNARELIRYFIFDLIILDRMMPTGDGIELISNKKNYINQFLYEYINTMNQSGSLGATDSTYGWDNYYNHYLYQSGWTYYGRVIGNPLFTLGLNKGRYSDMEYIINNRIKAHHMGFAGSISNQINYRVLYTYSENFGIFPDQDYFYSINKIYNFDGGLIQRSALIELIYNRSVPIAFDLRNILHAIPLEIFWIESKIY